MVIFIFVPAGHSTPESSDMYKVSQQCVPWETSKGRATVHSESSFFSLLLSGLYKCICIYLKCLKGNVLIFSISILFSHVKCLNDNNFFYIGPVLSKSARARSSETGCNASLLGNQITCFQAFFFCVYHLKTLIEKNLFVRVTNKPPDFRSGSFCVGYENVMKGARDRANIREAFRKTVCRRTVSVASNHVNCFILDGT